jgi:hypothetical protein
MLSPFAPLACALLCLALVGVRRMASDRAAWTMWLFPLSYTALFLTQRVFADRNFLPLLPFAAIAAAAGTDVIADRLRGRWSTVISTMTLAAIAARPSLGSRSTGRR